MRSVIGFLVAMTGLVLSGRPAAAAGDHPVRAFCGSAGTTSGVHVAQARQGPPAQIDVNRPRTPFDCSTPLGESWYGSTKRCLAEVCAGHNVYNEYIFEDNRRRKNPCYGQSPTDYPSSLE